MIDLLFKLLSLILTSFVSASVFGLSFLDEMKEVGRRESLSLKVCLKSFSNHDTMFLTYWVLINHYVILLELRLIIP